MDRRIHTNILYRVAEAVVTIASSIIQYSILARYLTQEDVGKYSLLLACMFFLNAFSFVFGTMSVVTRELTQGRDKQKVVTSAFLLQLAIAVIIAATLLPLVALHPYFAPIREGLLVVATVFLILVAPFLFSSLLSSREEMNKIAAINIAGQLVSLSLLILCVLNNARLFYIYLAYMSFNVVQVLLTIILSKWRDYFSLKSFDLTEAIAILKDSATIVLMIILAHLYVRIDVFMVDLFQGKEQVAQYTAAYNLLDYLMILSNTIMTAVFPNFTSFAKNDPTKFKQLYRRILQIFAIYLVPIALLIAFFSSSILRLIYGVSYSPAATSLTILMGATVFAWMNGPSGTIFISYKKQHIYVWGSLISLLVNVVGNLVLIPRFGYDGAAIATLLTELALCSFCLFQIHKMIGYVPFFTALDKVQSR